MAGGTLPDQHVTAGSVMLGQVRDEQSHDHRITRPPPAPVNELNRAAHDDRAFGPVGAHEPETIASPHRALLNEPGDRSAAAGEHEDIVNPEPEPARRFTVHASILSGWPARAGQIILRMPFRGMLIRRGIGEEWPSLK